MHIVTDTRVSFINDGSWRFMHDRAALLAALHAETASHLDLAQKIPYALTHLLL